MISTLYRIYVFYYDKPIIIQIFLSMLQHNYQPHIDVLRALAVMLVILNHLDFSLFSGGFIGVDIFFVISGYLITKNITKEKATTSNFSYKDFYTRRIIRLAPAFLTVILITSLIFIPIFTLEENQAYLKTVISSLSLTSNIYYTNLLSDYFSLTAKSTPLLHIWSLSLEEQFYLLWPLIIVFIFSFSKKFKISALLTIILVSLYISSELAKYNTIAAYYLLPSRVFEFAIGALIVFLPQIRNLSIGLSRLLGLVALAGMVFASVFIDKNTIFPSYNALFPCLFAALFIYTAQSWNINNLKPLQYIGKISYPMYLWHWPIIVYLSINSIALSTTIKLTVLLVTISFSALTFEFIEKKVRDHHLSHKNAFQKLFLAPFTLIILWCLLYSQYIQLQIDASQPNQQHAPMSNVVKCIDRPQHPIDECLFGDKTQSEIEILLVGDSHANAISGLIDQFALQAKKKGYEITQSATLFMPQTNLFKIINGEVKKIENFNAYSDRIEGLISNNSFKYVVIGGAFPAALSENTYKDSYDNEIFKEGIEKSIDLTLKHHAQPILVNDIPYLLNDIDTQCHIRNLNIQNCRYSKDLHDERIAEWHSILESLQKKYKTLIVINIENLICPDEFCYSYFEGISLYRDIQHLNYGVGAALAQKYLESSENPFEKD